MNLPVLSKLQDARVAAAVSFGDEDVAVRRGHDVVGLVEVVGGGGAAGLAERQQQLALGAELEDLVADGCARRGPQRRIRRGVAGAAAALGALS